MRARKHVLDRLRGQMSRGQAILFTGAGFSTDARNRRGDQLPGSVGLRDALHNVAFPTSPVDHTTTLGDAFSVALRHNQGATRRLLENRLSVDPGSLPEYYRIYYTQPWRRVYTLNFDDLEMAAAAQFSLPRRLVSVSATTDRADEPPANMPGEQLQVVHLNGCILDEPSDLLFSEPQYARQVATPNRWFVRCAEELRSRPVIYVGTELRESTLWTYIELRAMRRTSVDVLPPGSILVTPKLSPARAALLRDYNVDWLELNAAEFATEVLGKLGDDTQKGLTFLKDYDENYGRPGLPLVSELVTERPNLNTEYLMGDEPQWADLVHGRAAERSAYEELDGLANSVLQNRQEDTALAITGTAGAGKSTALMRLCLELSNSGVPVVWIDRDSHAAPQQVRQRVTRAKGKLVLAVDDADLYGRELSRLLRDLVPDRRGFLFVFAMRSSKLEEVSQAVGRAEGIELQEFTIPHLSDSDIDGLIDTLRRHHRLGRLAGLTTTQQRAALRNRCGRQLLVAMMEATSGELFEDKVSSELEELQGAQKLVYALLCVATSERHYLTKDEVALAAVDGPTDSLAALDALVRRGIVVAMRSAQRYRARHRVVAEVVCRRLREHRQMKYALLPLARALATKVCLPGNRRDRVWRLLVRILNHDYLGRNVELVDGRLLYNSIEGLLNSDYHYWLQRGSLEVELGDLRRAELFLNTARSMSPGDYLVDTEYAYLLVRKAVEDPGDASANQWFEGGKTLLEGVIATRGDSDAYPFHVLGSQGLAWVRRTCKSGSEIREKLGYYKDVVGQGLGKHPGSRDLRTLYGDIEREMLDTVVARTKSP